MSDDWYETVWAPVIAASEKRARQIRTAAPVCDVCGMLTVLRPHRHWSCEPGSLAGLTCVCRPGCSRQAYGDGDVRCADDCLVCGPRQGHRLIDWRAKT